MKSRHIYIYIYITIYNIVYNSDRFRNFQDHDLETL